MAEVEMAEKSPEQREQSMLNLICLIGAALFLALVAYNLFASGSVISTDGLFFTVVPLVLALSFLAVPGMDMWKKRKAAKAAQVLRAGLIAEEGHDGKRAKIHEQVGDEIEQHRGCALRRQGGQTHHHVPGVRNRRVSE